MTSSARRGECGHEALLSGPNKRGAVGIGSGKHLARVESGRVARDAHCGRSRHPLDQSRPLHTVPDVERTGYHPHVDARRRASHLVRSEEHTSELQSPVHLVCRLLLEKKKKKKTTSV